MKNSVKNILLYLGIYLLSILLPGIIYGLIEMYNLAQGDVELANFGSLLIQSIPVIFLFSSLSSLFLYIYILKRRNESLIKICDFHKISFIDAVVSSLIGITYYCLILLLKYLNFSALVPDGSEVFEKVTNGTGFLFPLLSLGLVVPIFEEILFRGLIFNELKRIMPCSLAIFIQALIFGAFHGNLFQGIFVSVLGVLACFIYIWVGSMWGPILVHTFYNMISILTNMLNAQESIANSGAFYLVIGTLFLVIAIIYLWRNFNKRPC